MLITKAQIIVIEDITGEDGRKAGERLRVLYQAIPTCGECGHPMKIRDFVWRTIITMSGCRGRIRVRRLVCTAADCYLHTHPRRNLPRGVLPHRLYSAEVHQAVAEGRDDVPCPPNTLHRILKWVRQMAACLIASGLFPLHCENVNDVPDETAGPLERLKNITGGGEDWFARAVERAAGRGGGLHWA